MPDREKIIKGLEECVGNGHCTKCSYRKGNRQVLSCKKLLADALELIKSSRLIHTEYVMSEPTIKDASILEGLKEKTFEQVMTKDEIFGIIDKYIEQRRKWIAKDKNNLLQSVENLNDRVLRDEINRFNANIITAQRIKARINYHFKKHKTPTKDKVSMIEDLREYEKKVYAEYGIPIPSQSNQR